jgi:hypothetical protein
VSLWKWDREDKHYKRLKMAGALANRGRCVIYGCGPSLADAPVSDEDFRLVVNHAYRLVQPTLWLGLDEPRFFPDIASIGNCVRVFRLNHAEHDIGGGVTARELPDALFLGLKEQGRDVVWEPPHTRTIFYWGRSTLCSACHFAIWLGFTEIAFAGVDLGVSRFDGQPPDPTDQRMRQFEFDFLCWFKGHCDRRGIRLSCLSKISRLNNFMG